MNAVTYGIDTGKGEGIESEREKERERDREREKEWGRGGKRVLICECTYTMVCFTLTRMF